MVAAIELAFEGTGASVNFLQQPKIFFGSVQIESSALFQENERREMGLAKIFDGKMEFLPDIGLIEQYLPFSESKACSLNRVCRRSNAPCSRSVNSFRSASLRNWVCVKSNQACTAAARKLAGSSKADSVKCTIESNVASEKMAFP